MLTREEMINKINEYKEKNFLIISPRMIQGGANLVTDYHTLQLYENKEIVTRNFVNELIVNLMCNNEEKKEIPFHVIFCGDFDDLADCLSFSNLLEAKQEKVVLIYSILDYVETRKYFIDFPQQTTINHYRQIYLDYSLFVSLLKENNIDIEVLKNEHQLARIPACYRDDTLTTFVLSNQKEKIDGQQVPTLKKKIESKTNI